MAREWNVSAVTLLAIPLITLRLHCIMDYDWRRRCGGRWYGMVSWIMWNAGLLMRTWHMNYFSFSIEIVHEKRVLYATQQERDNNRFLFKARKMYSFAKWCWVSSIDIRAQQSTHTCFSCFLPAFVHCKWYACLKLQWEVKLEEK